MRLVIETPFSREAENNSAFAYRVLRDNVMRMRLHPGEVLNEASLAGELGVSRTPVREALFRLRDEKLVDIYPHRASIVSRISFPLVHEGYFTRSRIEPMVTAMACGRLDDRTVGTLRDTIDRQERLLAEGGDLHGYHALDQLFHKILFQACRMEETWESVSVITTHYDRLRYFQVMSNAMRLELATAGHRMLLQALLDGDRSAVAAIAREQIFAVENFRQYLVGEFSDYFRDVDV